MSGFPVSWWDDHNPFIPYYMIMAHVMTNCITVNDCIAPFLRSNNCSTGAAPLLSSYFKRSLLRLSTRFRLDMASKSVGYFSFVCETMGGLGKILCHPWLNQNRRTLPRYTLPRYLTIPLHIANGFELWHFENCHKNHQSNFQPIGYKLQLANLHYLDSNIKFRNKEDHLSIPVVPHKAVAEVSKIGNV